MLFCVTDFLNLIYHYCQTALSKNAVHRKVSFNIRRHQCTILNVAIHKFSCKNEALFSGSACKMRICLSRKTCSIRNIPAYCSIEKPFHCNIAMATPLLLVTYLIVTTTKLYQVHNIYGMFILKCSIRNTV